MNFLDKQFGRMGNRMFQMAFCYAYARDKGINYYFQDPKWFERYGDEIKSLYRQDGPPLDYVSVHIRRAGNPQNPSEPAYAKNSFYQNLWESGYYENAIKWFPEDKLLIFSDDIEWCKKNITWESTAFHEGNELEDFSAMARCKHNIIANSSYSWWAAYVNENPKKIVIAPKKWFTDPSYEQFIGFPKEWIRI